jgi:hydrogenase maturation protease
MDNNNASKLVLLGLGNLLLSDEGLGIRALELLRERYLLPESTEWVDGGVLGMSLLAYLEGTTHLLVTDAVQTGCEPGTLVRFVGEEIPAGLSLNLSMHQIGFRELMAICQLRGSEPRHIAVHGIEPSTLESGVTLSGLVESKLEQLLEAVVEELRRWGFQVSAR